jgi:hypothetical protein
MLQILMKSTFAWLKPDQATVDTLRASGLSLRGCGLEPSLTSERRLACHPKLAQVQAIAGGRHHDCLVTTLCRLTHPN